VKSRWLELRADLFTNAKILGVSDSLTSVLGQAQVRNWQRWGCNSYSP